MKSPLLRSTLSLLLLTSIPCLTGCKAQPTPPPVDTSWVKPILFHQQTKDWLAGLDWPPTAYDDFDQIAKFNAKYYAITGQARPATQPTTQPASTQP